jgi:hypothetical protein
MMRGDIRTLNRLFHTEGSRYRLMTDQDGSIGKGNGRLRETTTPIQLLQFCNECRCLRKQPDQDEGLLQNPLNDFQQVGPKTDRLPLHHSPKNYPMTSIVYKDGRTIAGGGITRNHRFTGGAVLLVRSAPWQAHKEG